MRTMDIVAVGVSASGACHEKDEIPNQDSVLVCLHDGFGAIAVADGLGSCARSHEGAYRAVRITLDMLGQRCTAGGSMDDPRAIMEQITFAWKRSFQGMNVREFDTTLLFAAVCGQSVLAGGIGDGMIQLSAAGHHAIEVLPPRSGFADQTTSIASEGALAQLAFARFDIETSHLPFVALLATDGVSDDVDPCLRPRFASTVGAKLLADGVDKARSELTGWLQNWITPGSTDDRSLAVLAVTNRSEACV